jgi:uncharacterized protein
MDLNPAVRIHDLLAKHPFLQDFLIAYHPHLEMLKNAAMRATVGRVATLDMVAAAGGVPVERLLADLQAEIAAHADATPVTSQDAPAAAGFDEIGALKTMIRRLHGGERLSALKEEYASVLSSMDPMRVVEMEQQLVDGGTKPEEIQHLCDLHLEIFRRALD